ncbi:hypothetical protein VNO77_21766 [Canavalia gladiata]|uniref:Uncharacterized protein n=1 Tax=Canavalia gladiata TaxID=3824 RepID=A0AAN9QAF6_CANGL
MDNCRAFSLSLFSNEGEPYGLIRCSNLNSNRGKERWEGYSRPACLTNGTNEWSLNRSCACSVAVDGVLPPFSRSEPLPVLRQLKASVSSSRMKYPETSSKNEQLPALFFATFFPRLFSKKTFLT